MVYPGNEIERLVLATQRCLLPAPFPPRRDLDVAFLASEAGADDTVFHDAFWVRPDEFACLVARVGGAARGRLTAHALRALMRAALRLHPVQQALTICLHAFATFEPDIAVDAAITIVCTRTGDATFASRGEAEALHAPHEGAPPAMHHAGRGFGWLSVGAVRLPPAEADWDAGDLVRNAITGTSRSGAAAVGVRSLSGRSDRTFVLPNEIAQISPLLSDIGDYAMIQGIPAEIYAGVEIALDEHLTNVLLYAYADGRAHEVIVKVRVADTTLRIDVEDDGMPFDPTVGPPPDLDVSLDERPIGGLGLHLIRSVFDDVAYERSRGWNVLRLTRHADPRSVTRTAPDATMLGDGIA